MKSLIRKFAVAGFLLALSLASFTLGKSVPAFGLVAFAQETDDQVKIDMYKKFVDNRIPNPRVAYQAARDYLQKYSKEKDQYTDYLQKWVLFYERDDRKLKLPVLIYNDKNFAEAYRTGAQVLADEPNYLRAQIDLGYAGYLATSEKNEAFNADALGYAHKAIQALESGKTPADWAPFKGKDDTLAYLYYTVGFLNLKSAPDQAIEPLLKAAQFESDLKKAPSTYYFLAVAYQSGPYKTLSTAYQTTYANKPETPESKAALEKSNVVIDRIIDAYARAIAAAGTDPKNAQNKTQWLATLTSFYKFRHQDSDAGLTEFIAAALTKPLPAKP
jgi:hypothetical protein